MGRKYTSTRKFSRYVSTKARTKSRGHLSCLASRPALETATVSTCRYTREGSKLRVYSVLLACSWRMRVGSVTTGALRGRGEGERETREGEAEGAG